MSNVILYDDFERIAILCNFVVCIFFVCRSGVRLRSIGSGHTHLKLLISDLSSTRQRYKDLLTTQTSASHRLERWSQAEESPAIQDVLHQTHELNLMWMEAQREFVGKLQDGSQLMVGSLVFMLSRYSRLKGI